MSVQTLFELKASAPGLPGPYLQENTAPYRAVDIIGTKKIQVVTMIGGRGKRTTLSHHFGLNRSSTQNYSVALGSWPEPNGKIILDCELHLQPDVSIPKLIGGFQPGHLHYHLLQLPSHSVADIAGGLYYNVLPLFSDLVMLFVSDLGGIENVISMLCCWMQKAITDRRQYRVRIALMFGSSDEISDDIIFNRWDNSMLYQSGAKSAQYTLNQIKQARKQLFHISLLRHSDNIMNDIESELRIGTIFRSEAAVDFSALNWRLLFQEAVAQYGTHQYPHFDMVSAARHHYPVPDFVEDCILDLLKNCKENSKLSHVIASALVMDAFPPKMHSFLPDKVIETLYMRSLRRCEEKMKIPDFALKVKLQFAMLTSMALKQGKDSAKQHIEIMQANSYLSKIHTHIACSICIIRPAEYLLNCKHRLCDSCVQLFSEEIDAWRFRHVPCLVCSDNQANMNTIQPPTAGKRVLNLGGANSDRTWIFFKGVADIGALNSMSIFDHFDILSASELGKWSEN
ncbi:hypothetical protein V8C42DRAFT_361749 [Trichoderma barbatum]